MSNRLLRLAASAALLIGVVAGCADAQVPDPTPSGSTMPSGSPTFSPSKPAPLTPSPSTSGVQPGSSSPTSSGESQTSAPSGTDSDITPSTMAALGDSITVASVATAALAAQPEYSWSTGSNADVDSVYLRLKARNPSLTRTNLAVPGARAGSLATQAGNVPESTDLVTVLMGTNDACTARVSTMTSPSSFRASIRAALAALVGREVGRIVVASIPDIHQLWQVGSASSDARSTWTLFGICQSMLANPDSSMPADQTRRQEVRERVIEFNDVLASECRALAQLHGQRGGGGTDCVFDDNAVFSADLTLGDLSAVDFFHPSPQGQRRLAEAVSKALGYATP